MKRVVVLGGGFGGLTTAQQLEKRCRHSCECEVVLIDRNAEHLYTPLLYEAATGFLDSAVKQGSSRLRAGAGVRFSGLYRILKKRINFIRGSVVSVDTQARMVKLENGKEITYDYLVVALGSEPAYYGIPGLEKNAVPLKRYEDAIEIRSRIRSLLKDCISGKKDCFTITIVGAGPSGVECSAELANYFRKLERKRRLQTGSIRVQLLEGSSEILPMLPRAYRVVAMRRLRRLGVRVIIGTFVTKVEEEQIHAAPNKKAGNSPFKDDIKLESNLLIWSGGVQPSRIIQNFGLPLTERNAINVDQKLRVKGHDNIFALGDCANVHDPVQHKSVPHLAFAAFEQGGLVADNILRDIEGEDLRSVCGRLHWTTIVPLGGRYAVTQLGGMVFKGFPAYIIRRAADLSYFAHILPFFKALRVWFGGVRTFLNND